MGHKNKNSPASLTSSLRVVRDQSDLFYHDDSDKIVVRTADLRSYFREFKDAVQKAPNLATIVGIVAIWTPLFTSDFRAIWKINAEYVTGGYAAAVFLITLYIVIQWVPRISRFISWNKEWLSKTEIDPDKKVEEIRQKCK